jgi:hypothetical protein
VTFKDIRIYLFEGWDIQLSIASSHGMFSYETTVFVPTAKDRPITVPVWFYLEI